MHSNGAVHRWIFLERLYANVNESALNVIRAVRRVECRYTILVNIFVSVDELKIVLFEQQAAVKAICFLI